jgi:hypothetical protein
MNRHPKSPTYPKEVVIWLHPRMPLDTTKAVSVPVLRLMVSIAFAKKKGEIRIHMLRPGAEDIQMH